MKYNITLIAATAKNRVIGKNNELLWHLPKDFAWFKEKTKGYDIVMGRKTMESIMAFTKGKPLPLRNNIVLSKEMKEKEGFTILNEYQDVLNLSLEKEIIIIGGEKIYDLFMPYANKIILTEIDKDFDGDAFFPEFDKSKYTITYEQKENENNLDYRFVIYQK
jgi:dihydrofolate reductase